MKSIAMIALIAMIYDQDSFSNHLWSNQISGQEKYHQFSNHLIGVLGSQVYTFKPADTTINKEKKYFIKNLARYPLNRISSPVKIQNQKKKINHFSQNAILLYFVKNSNIGDPSAIALEKK